jgi:hypothetical protein
MIKLQTPLFGIDNKVGASKSTRDTVCKLTEMGWLFRFESVFILLTTQKEKFLCFWKNQELLKVHWRKRVFQSTNHPHLQLHNYNLFQLLQKLQWHQR